MRCLWVCLILNLNYGIEGAVVDRVRYRKVDQNPGDYPVEELGHEVIGADWIDRHGPSRDEQRVGAQHHVHVLGVCTDFDGETHLDLGDSLGGALEVTRERVEGVDGGLRLSYSLLNLQVVLDLLFLVFKSPDRVLGMLKLLVSFFRDILELVQLADQFVFMLKGCVT
eukprot:509856-Amorphochlora_amoeboformis.AAC.2